MTSPCGKRRGHGAGKRGEHAPIGIAEFGCDAEHEKTHDVNHAPDASFRPQMRRRASPAPPRERADRQRQGRTRTPSRNKSVGVERWCNFEQRAQYRAIAVARRGLCQSQIGKTRFEPREELSTWRSHDAEGRRRDGRGLLAARLRPSRDGPKITSSVVSSRCMTKSRVPWTSRRPSAPVVTLAGEQRGLLVAPLHRELVLSAEMRDAAEIEHHNRMQWVLPLGTDQPIVDPGTRAQQAVSAGSNGSPPAGDRSVPAIAPRSPG